MVKDIQDYYAVKTELNRDRGVHLFQQIIWEHNFETMPHKVSCY